MTTKTPDKPAPRIGDVIESGTLPDGRPFDVIYLDAARSFKMTRIFVRESDKAFDDSLNPDDTTNPRLNGRLQLAYSIVEPKSTIDDFDNLTAVDLEALFRAFNRLNTLPRADASGNA